MGRRGPNTRAGKGNIRHNAVTHGITSVSPVVGDELETEWERHRAAIVDSLQPATDLELKLAERAALLLWRLDRVRRHEREAIWVSRNRIEDDAEQQLIDERQQLTYRELHNAGTAAVPPDVQEALRVRYPKEDMRSDDQRRPILIERLRRERILPDERTMETILRYEAAFSKQLYQVLHELEALQTRREGQQTLLEREMKMPVDGPEIIETEPARHLD